MFWKKSKFKGILYLATKESYFIFNNIWCKQIDGVAMGSPLGSSLANTFLAYHEQNYSPLEYRRSTFSGVYTHFNIFLPDTYKIGMIYTWINRCFRICSNSSMFNLQLILLRKIFQKYLVLQEKIEIRKLSWRFRNVWGNFQIQSAFVEVTIIRLSIN